jgi:hypothetical protein
MIIIIIDRFSIGRTNKLAFKLLLFHFLPCFLLGKMVVVPFIPSTKPLKWKSPFREHH